MALIALVAALIVGYLVQGSGGGGSAPHASASRAVEGTVALSSLPVQARRTVALIRAGGPFPFPSDDGAVFHNYEHALPSESDGYYHEYTVPTPGSPDRGARRIVTGRDGHFWYTDDHYDTFRQLDVQR